MKKLSLVCCTLASFALSAVDVDRVYCDVQKVFQNSSAGQELAKWSELKNSELNQLLSAKQADLRKTEQELASGKLPEDLAQLKTLNLEHAKRQASLDIERTKADMEAQLSQKMRLLEGNIRETIKAVALEQKYNEVIPTSQATALFFSEKLDKTPEFLEAFNKASRAEAAKSLLRSPDSAKAPEFLRA